MTPAEFMTLFAEFRAASWDGWRAVLARLAPGVREFWAIVGRGAGKSRYDALAADLGPFDSALARFEASRVAVAMLNLEAASRALGAARRARESGRGRRPSPRDLERLVDGTKATPEAAGGPA